MYPILVGEGVWALPSYFTLVMLGFFVCGILLRREFIRVGWDAVRAIDMVFALVVASLIGARLAHVLFDGYLSDYIYLCLDPSQLADLLPNGQACQSSNECIAAQNMGYNIGGICTDGHCVPERDCFRSLMFWSGGLTYYGGLILACVTAFFLCRRWKLPFLSFSDLTAPLVALGLAFGRLGCFLAGCCFGKTTDMPWGLRFPEMSDAFKHHRDLYPDALSAQFAETGIWASLPVHPTQLYECFGALALFAFLWFYRRKRIAFEGQALGELLSSYAVLRFVIEIWRDDVRGGYLLSTSQWISIGTLIFGIALIIHGRRRSA